MKLIIFGATGTIGTELLLQAVELNHQVTAFARTPEKLAQVKHRLDRIVNGDVLDPDSVAKSIEGHDAVLVALGAGREGKVRAEGTRNIVRGMQRHGVQRLICQTTLGAGDSWSNLNFFWKRIMFGWFLKSAFEDHQLQEKIVIDSGLSWTIVRPAAFTDGPITGSYKHGFSPTAKSVSLKISRKDVALFMLMQLTSDEYLRKTPGLSY